MKPMLAATLKDNDISKLRYPLIGSPKIDGIRALVVEIGNVPVVVSRQLKPLRSNAVNQLFNNIYFFSIIGFDGEIVYGFPSGENVYNDTVRAVMSENLPYGMNADNLTYYIFDSYVINGTYEKRYEYLRKFINNNEMKTDNYILHNVELIKNRKINNIDELSSYEVEMLKLGYEGIMLRDPQGKYKYGRSTLKEGYLLKLKQHQDREAIIIGYEEQMINNNPSLINQLGYRKKSDHKDNMAGAGILGSLVVRDEIYGDFNIGSGFDKDDRITLWKIRESLIGRIIKYKYQEQGIKDKPRFPVYLGFRMSEDM